MARNIQSPYSTKFFSGEIRRDYDPTTNMKMYKREERETHSPQNTLPYELATLPDYFGAIVTNAIEAGNTIDRVLDVKEFTDEEKKSLLKLKKATEKIIDYLVRNVDSTLEPLTIGNKHALDDVEEAEFEEKRFKR